MNRKSYFPLLIGATLIITLLSSFVLNTDELLINNLSDQLTQNQINELIEINKKWEWLGYLFIPVLLIIKVSLISAVLHIGLFLFNKKIQYKTLFTAVTKAEFIFVFMGMIKLIWFTLKPEYTFEDLQHFYPLSALSVVGYKELSPWFLYPFQTLNLFELVYWIALAYLIGKKIKISTDKALKIVASSYGSALLIWTVAIMFFSLNAN